MANVDEVRNLKFFCPNCLQEIYRRSNIHICGQKRLIGARQINITISDTDGFVVQEGQRFIDKLGWGEMLEVLIALSHPGLDKRVPYGPMMTHGEWMEREKRWRECLRNRDCFNDL
jgi:hypothetical protein